MAHSERETLHSNDPNPPRSPMLHLIWLDPPDSTIFAWGQLWQGLKKEKRKTSIKRRLLFGCYHAANLLRAENRHGLMLNSTACHLIGAQFEIYQVVWIINIIIVWVMAAAPLFLSLYFLLVCHNRCAVSMTSKLTSQSLTLALYRDLNQITGDYHKHSWWHLKKTFHPVSDLLPFASLCTHYSTTLDFHYTVTAHTRFCIHFLLISTILKIVLPPWLVRITYALSILCLSP